MSGKTKLSPQSKLLRSFSVYRSYYSGFCANGHTLVCQTKVRGRLLNFRDGYVATDFCERFLTLSVGESCVDIVGCLRLVFPRHGHVLTHICTLPYVRHFHWP